MHIYNVALKISYVVQKKSAIQLHADERTEADRLASFYMHRDLGLGYILHSSVDSQHGCVSDSSAQNALHFTFSCANSSKVCLDGRP